MKIVSRNVVLAVILFTITGISGCSWFNKDQQGPFQGSGYRNMLELQKQKAAFLSNDLDTVNKIPEPDAEEMERLGTSISAREILIWHLFIMTNPCKCNRNAAVRVTKKAFFSFLRE